MAASDVRIVSDPETLRVMADPLRLRILVLLRERPGTVTELADRLQIGRTQLYYHIGLLERHELIRVDETRQINGIAEKRYAPTAFRLSVAKSLLGASTGGGSVLDTFLTVLFDEVTTAIHRAIDVGLIDVERTADDRMRPGQLMIGRNWYRLSDDDVAELERRYTELHDAFLDRMVDHETGREPDARPGTQLYEWLIGFYPVAPPEKDGGA